MQTTSAQSRPGFFNKPLAFWGKCLMATSAGVSSFGMAMVLFQDTMDKFVWHPLLFSQSKLHLTFTPEIAHYVHEIYGVLGAVMVGWGLIMYSHVKHTFDTHDMRNWNALATSLGTWYVVDSVFSLHMGYWQNAVLNTGFAVAFLVPMLAARKYFRNVRSSVVPEKNDQM